MEFQKFADTYVVRLDKGEEIIASLRALCEKVTGLNLFKFV